MMLLVLFSKEILHALAANIFQIFLHAHFVVFSISIIHTVDMFARILITFKTEDGITTGSMVYT